jgi:hypothetical protein
VGLCPKAAGIRKTILENERLMSSHQAFPE